MKITVIGMGRLGTVAAGGLAAAGHEVTGLDVDERRVRALREGLIPFYEPGLGECVTGAVGRGNLGFLHVDDMTEELVGVALITAGTPAAASGEVDMRQVHAALAWVRGRRSRDLVLVMKSTVPPGSGEQFLRKDLKGLEVDYLANPEFLREGRALHDWQFPDRIVLGAESCAGQAVNTVREMYAGVDSPLLVTDITSAEMIKYASNAFMATRISFINEMASLCDATGASIDAVSDALALDGRSGTRIHAGVGYGGSCLPKDLHALKHLSHSHGIESNLLTEVVRVNDQQRRIPIDKLHARFRGRLEGLQVGVLGLAFKPETDDIREAPSLALVHELVERGAKVRAFDPIANAPASKALPSCVQFVDGPEETAEGAQALILLTEWQEIVGAEWEAMAAQMLPPKFVFDGRNALPARHMGRLGFEYVGIGRGDTRQRIPLQDQGDLDARAPGLEPVARNSAPSQPRRQSEFRYA